MAIVETAPVSIAAMRRVLAYLAEERHQLHARAADPAELEANSRAMAAMQARLLRTLGRTAASGQ